MQGAESIGEVVSGAMAARAVEPGAGEAGGHGTACLNCGTALVGEFCHSCGQAAHVHRTLHAFWHDLAHGVLHFEGKIWRTLPLLAWRPGDLTRRYIEGERARFVSPMAIFLFSVFLMFAVFSMLVGTIHTGATTKPAAAIAAERENVTKELGRLEAKKAEAVQAKSADVEDIDKEIAETKEELRGLGIAGNVIGAPTGTGTAVKEDVNLGWVANSDGKSVNLGWLEASYKKAKENPDLLIYKLQSNAYKFSWMLIPISVPFVWLLFMFRRRYKLYDHTIFVTYSLAFMSLLVIVLSLLPKIGVGGGFIASAAMFVPPFHMYRQLRGAYQLSRLSAAWRMIALTCFAFVAATFFLLILIALASS